MKLYKCRPEDLDDVISIGRETYSETFHSMNRPETMEMYLSESFSPEKIEGEFKGSGYGRYVMEKVLSLAKEYGCRYVWLGVWEKNERAIHFYRKMGFEISDTHTFRMGDELQNDFVMKRVL